MAISLLPKHLGRYSGIARLLLRHGRPGLVRAAGPDQVLHENGSADDDDAGAESAERLAADLEALGPTFIKLGQLLSTRADLLPPPYLEALSRLQDHVEPVPFEELEPVITDELGVRLSKAFASFETEPLAAASLGQVHRASLRDGRVVAVKVQRPGIRPRVRDDLAALAELAEFIDAHTDTGRQLRFQELIAEFKRTIARELDYLQEAGNLRTLSQNLREFTRLVVPTPVDDYTTSRVLTMDYVHGRKITGVSPLARIELDGVALCQELFDAYLKQIFLDGLFHADPHPGNIFVTDDGRLALLDLGMTGHITAGMQDRLLKLVIAVAEGDGETVARLSLELGEARQDVDVRGFTREVSQLVLLNRDRTVVETDVGRTVLETMRIASSFAVRQPPELALLGKALLNLDAVARVLAPEFNPTESVRERAAELLRRRMLRSVSPGAVLTNALELNEFLQSLPGRVNRLFERVVDSRFEVKVRAIDEVKLIAGIEKVANRITLGLVLAALIVGAAMLMQVDTRFRILGYPGLPILFFVAAALGGVALIYSILAHDVRSPRSGRRKAP